MSATAFPMPTENWVDRYGAWILSLCTHVLLACWFFNQTFDLVLEAPSASHRPIRILFAPAGALPSPGPALAALAPPPMSALPETEAEAQAKSPLPSPETSPTDQADAETERQRQQEREIAEILDTYTKYASPHRKATLDAQAERRNRVQKIALGVAAIPYFQDFSEGRVGPIRVLNLDNSDSPHVKEVMDRYGIRTDEGFIPTVPPSYLSSASVGDQVYHATGKPGYHEYFVIPEKALRKMVQLEQNYLWMHGYTPAACRIDSVTFGVVQTIDGQWDLGILGEIQVQEYTPLGKPASADD